MNNRIGTLNDQGPSGGFLLNMDWLTLLIYLALCTIGFLNIYAVEFTDTREVFFDMSTNYSKQLMWIGISLLLGIIILIIDARFYTTLAYGIYLAILLVLVMTLVLGKEVAGSKSWLQLGSFSLQPSEFAKFATALAISKLLNTYQVNLQKTQDMVLGFLLIVLPVGLVLLQNDTGSAIVFLGLTLVLFREGLHPAFLVIPIFCGILFLSVLLLGKLVVLGFLVAIAVIILNAMAKKASRKAFLLLFTIFFFSAGVVYGVDYAFNEILQPHQRERIEVLLGQKVDMKGAGYNVHQSLIAIGSGGLSGKGFLNGTQTKFQFVPEQHTDFIFCTIGEEHGFFGSAGVVLLFAALLIRIIFRAEKQKHKLVRAYGYGVVSILLVHFMVNIGMTIGLLPVIGIPLPFISYGGSSLLGFTTLLFLYLKLDASFQYDFV